MQKEEAKRAEALTYGQVKAGPDMPRQTAVGEEAPPKKKNPVLKAVLWILAAAAVCVLLVLAYLFLLVGEPEKDAKNIAPVKEAAVAGPMNPLEAFGEGSLTMLPDAFGGPVLVLNGDLTPEKSRVNDTAFGGGFARMVTISYPLADGVPVSLVSLRPTAAVSLLEGNGFTLDGSKLYTLAGLNAARMDNGQETVLFSATDTAIYAVRFPTGRADEVLPLLQRTGLMQNP